MKEHDTDARRLATAKIDAQREPAARALDNTAGRLRERSADLTSATSRAAEVTADKLQATAHYLRENDVRAMMDDVEDVVRQHPGPALAAAAVVGFLVGRALRRND